MRVNIKNLLMLLALAAAFVAIPLGAAADTYTPEEYQGELPVYDATPYTWKVNAALGGATNLPAVQLAATGRYSNVTNVNDELLAAVQNTTFVDANNLILMISDGLGDGDILLSEKYAGELILNNLPNKGASATKSYDLETGTKFVTTDSAAGGTALASGFKTRYSYEGLNVDGKDIPQITEVLKEKYGKIIGVVSTGWAYDATPACFGGAHAIRGNSGEIARDIMRGYVPDLFIGQGVDDYSSTFNSYVVELICKGVETIHTDWNTAVTSGQDCVWVSVPADVRYNDDFSETQPTISQMMAFSLSFLQAKSERKGNTGFFLMFENGMTDDAGHNNDINQMIGEVQATDEAMAIALKFACENPDTMVIQTADHDTGGMTLKEGWENDLSKCTFTTSGHSQQNVSINAIGKNTEVFNGQEMYNCQAGKVMAHLMGVSDFGTTEKEYAIDDIVAGIKVNVGGAATAEDLLQGDVLHIRADQDTSSLQFALNGLGANAHDMITVAVKVPAGATSLKISGTEVLLEQKLDKAMNYVEEYDYYFLTFKTNASFSTLNFQFAGDIKANDEIWLDNLVVAANSTDFTGYDIAQVTAGDKVTAAIAGTTALPNQSPQPDASETPPAEKDNTPWIWIGVGAAAAVAVAVVVVILVSRKKK